MEYHPTTLPLTENVYTVVRTKGLSTFQTLCALSDNFPNPTYLSLGHFLVGEPLTRLPAIDKTNVNLIVFQVANVPTTGTAFLAELINLLPPRYHLSRLLAEIQASLQPDPCVPYPVILSTLHLIPELF